MSKTTTRQILCVRDALEQQRPCCLPFTEKKRNRAVRLIDVRALVVASGSTNLDVHLLSCHMRDVLRYCRARAMMLVCLEIISGVVLVRAAVLFCDRIER